MSQSTHATTVKHRTANALTQSSVSVPTWTSWESLGFSEEQPLKAEYFVKKNYPKDLARRLESQLESEKREMGKLVLPLTLRRVKGRETIEWIADDPDTDEECETTDEMDSEGSDIEEPLPVNPGVRFFLEKPTGYKKP